MRFHSCQQRVSLSKCDGACEMLREETLARPREEMYVEMRGAGMNKREGVAALPGGSTHARRYTLVLVSNAEAVYICGSFFQLLFTLFDTRIRFQFPFPLLSAPPDPSSLSWPPCACGCRR